MDVICKLLTLLSIFCQLSYSIKDSSFRIIVDELSVGKPRNYTLNSTVIYLIDIKNLPNVIEKVPPRIFIQCKECNGNNPLLIVVSQNKGIMSWELPIVIESNSYSSVYKNTERTLCPYDMVNDTKVSLSKANSSFQDIHPVVVTLSTSNNKNVIVEFLVNLEQNFVLNLNQNKSVTVTPSTPKFYLFEFKSKNITSVLLHITSEDDTCLIVSVQNVACPVFDLEENVQYRGHFQTVTKKGGFTITKDKFPNGFYVVLIVSGSDKYCSNMLLTATSERSKNISITIEKTISFQEYTVAITVTLAVVILFCITMFVIFYFSIKSQNSMEPNLEDEILNDNLDASISAAETLPCQEPSPIAPVTPVTSTSAAQEDTLSIKTDSSLHEIDFDLVNDAELDKDIYRMKNTFFLSDLARKNQSILKKKSELYFWNLLTVAIFYFLPVCQLVFNDEYNFDVSGKQDLCYYNFLCSHPLWLFRDFSHMFSNIGYIAFGALFMFLVAMKERDYKVKICNNRKLYKNYGIPQHFGIFYSMGAALIIEGLLSLCYHICPNHYNFQFDISFMYVICTLCVIKIYQTRHPDINASACATFSLLAGVIVLEMYGIFSSNLSFWILFTILHLSTCIYLSLQIYYMGRFRLRWLLSFRTCHWRFFFPMFRSRFCMLFIANVCNWGLAIGSFIYEIKNFSSYLLSIFMVNLVLYTTFYILMKFICKEKLPLQSIIYILLAMISWSAALYFFFSKTISWKLTPAQSKLYNQKCKLLDFYDNHDIWHFISAAAMFFSFMVLLTFDDDLIYTHRSKIIVF